jgi:hypothetical protein
MINGINGNLERCLQRRLSEDAFGARADTALP